MRTIRLREHQPQTERLTPQELREILAASPRLVRVTQSGHGRFVLRPGSVVGALALPSVRLLIRPKVKMQNLFFMLGFVTGVRWGREDFPYEYEDDFLRAAAWWFDREVGRAVQHGLNRDYVDREETLTLLRGRLAIGRQIAARPGRSYPAECRFQEYSEDTPTNQVVKAAHDLLLRTPGLNRALTSRLMHRSRQAFGDVTSVGFRRADVPKVAFNRLNRHWESAVRLAQMVLRQQSLRDERGEVVGSGFTVDMNRLFERFIEATVQEAVTHGALSLEPQATRQLSAAATTSEGLVVPAVRMRPDLLLLAGQQPVAVGDAKYKELRRVGDWEHPDLYQLLAYCVRFGLDRGLLIYAGKRPITESRVHGTEITLGTAGVDLSGTPAEILTEARNASSLLIGAAAKTRPKAQGRAA